MRETRQRGAALRGAAMTIAGAVLAPLAWAAGRVLTHPVLPHAIAAPRRVTSTTLGRISYYEDDGASGLPVLLLHDVSVAGSAFELRGLFDALRADRPVLAPDLPGYGFSERRGVPYAREDYVRFVDELVTEMSRRYGATVDIVCVGTAGELAARAIVRSARHVRSLAIIGPTGFGAERWAARTLRRALGGALIGRLAHRLTSSAPALRMRISRRSNGPLAEGLVRYARVAAQQPRASSAAVAALSGALSDPRIAEDVYDALRVPVCFLHGSEAGLPREEVDLLVAGHDAWRRSELRGAREMPHVERPVETAEALRAFFRTLAVKPELRVIRGERSARTLVAARRGAMRTPARRRSWT